MRNINAKHIVVFILICLILSVLAFNNNGWSPVRFFIRTGELSRDNMKVFVDTFTCTNGNGFTIDYSAAGFTVPPKLTITAQRNTGDSIQVPNVSIKTWGTNSSVLNITEGNPATVSILGIDVLSGPPVRFLRQSIILHVEAIGK